MSDPLDWSMVQEAQRRAQMEILDEIKTLTELNVGSQGETFGTQHMTIADRILAFIDDREMGVHDRVVNGILVPGTLRTVNPEVEDRMQREFLEDVQSSPMFSHLQYAENIRAEGTESMMQGVMP